MYTVMYWLVSGCMRQCHVMCHTGGWHCHGLTSAPPTLTSHYWFQMLDDHCHIHTVIVNLALQRQRRQPRKSLFTKSTLQFYKIKETCECNVHLLEKHVTYSLLISTHQPQTPGQRQLGFVTLSVAVHQCNLWPVPGLHRVSDVRIMQYCHIGSDTSSSQPTRRNGKDNQDGRYLLCAVQS